MKLRSMALKVSVLAAASLLVACGDNVKTFDLSGDGVKGPVFGATVQVFRAGTTTVVKNCGTTLRDGSYTCTIEAGTDGPFKVVLSGGEYCSDESQVQGTAPATTCAGGATKVSNVLELSTIAVQDSTGAIANAPITPLTTAVAQAASDPAQFVTKYRALARTLGIDENPTVTPTLATGSRTTEILKQLAAAPAATVTNVITNLATLADVPLASVTAPVGNSVELGAGVVVDVTSAPVEVTTDAVNLANYGVIDEITETGGTALTGAATN